MLHVNGFTYEPEKEKALKYFVDRMAKAMNFKDFNEKHIQCFHNLRDVSAISHQYCVSFYLPEEVAFMKDVPLMK